MSARGGASGSPAGAGIRSHDRLQHLVHALPGLRGDAQDGVRRAADQVADLARDPLGLSPRQVDLVQDRDQLEPGLDCGIGVGDGLRFDPLGGVDHQQRSLARGEAARDLVGEVDVARGVDQMQVVLLAVVGRVGDPHGLGLDRDSALALEVHRVEHLGHVLARVDRPGELEDAVRERRLAVVDVGDDREVADPVHGSLVEVGRSRIRAPGRAPPSRCAERRAEHRVGAQSVTRRLGGLGGRLVEGAPVAQERHRIGRRARVAAAVASLEVQVVAPA